MRYKRLGEAREIRFLHWSGFGKVARFNIGDLHISDFRVLLKPRDFFDGHKVKSVIDDDHYLGTDGETYNTKIPVTGISLEKTENYAPGDPFFFSGDKTSDGYEIPNFKLHIPPSFEEMESDNVEDGQIVRLVTTSGNYNGKILLKGGMVHLFNNDSGHECNEHGYRYKRTFMNKSILDVFILRGDPKCIFCQQELVDSNPYGVCYKCLEENCKLCRNCSIPHNNSYYGYCKACADHILPKCFTCKEIIDNEHAIEWRGNFYCPEHIVEVAIECEDCGRLYPKDGICERCEGLVLHDYNFKPRPKFFGDGNVFLGIELETEWGSANRDTILAECKTKWNYLKRDGSLKNGVECVTQPLTYAWIQDNSEEIKNYLANMIKKGGRSYDTTTCGIHIHISNKEENGDEIKTPHFLNLLRTVYSNPAFILAISQRRIKELRDWANIEPEDPNGRGHDNIDRISALAAGKFNSSSKYQAIRVMDKTMEFRIFKGTLDFMSFMKNIDFVWAVYQFSKDCRETSAKEFTEWVMDQKGFIYLKAFMLKNKAIIEKAVGCKPLEGEIPQIDYYKNIQC